MCRFTAYSGKKSYFLDEVLINPSNSLLNQSLHPKESRHHINADGFGVSWFNDKHNNTKDFFFITVVFNFVVLFFACFYY